MRAATGACFVHGGPAAFTRTKPIRADWLFYLEPCLE